MKSTFEEQIAAQLCQFLKEKGFGALTYVEKHAKVGSTTIKRIKNGDTPSPPTAELLHQFLLKEKAKVDPDQSSQQVREEQSDYGTKEGALLEIEQIIQGFLPMLASTVMSLDGKLELLDRNLSMLLEVVHTYREGSLPHADTKGS